MTHRERVLKTLRREPPDRVPVDIGGTLASTLNVHTYRRLMNHLGFGDDPPVAYLSRRSNAVLPDEQLLRHLDVDCRAVILGSPDQHPEQELPDGTITDEWGVTWKHVGEGQHYINTRGPFYKDDPDGAAVAAFSWPDPLDPGRYRSLRSQAHTHQLAHDAALVLVLGIGPLHQLQFMRGYAGALEDLIANPEFVQAFLDRYADFWVRMAERALKDVAELIDVVMFGDDLGTQQAPVMSPALYRRILKPTHMRMVQTIKRFGKPVLLHSCGSVAALIPDLIEVGFDALHPIQVSAKDMDTARLKKEFGRDIAFWGGIDTHRVLPRGTLAEVRAEVKQRIADLAPGGGYILGAVHNIQAEVPVENVLAMVNAAREFGGY